MVNLCFNVERPTKKDFQKITFASFIIIIIGEIRQEVVRKKWDKSEIQRKTRETTL